MKCRLLSNQESSLMYLYCLTFLKKGKHVNSDLYLPFFLTKSPLTASMFSCETVNVLMEYC